MTWNRELKVEFGEALRDRYRSYVKLRIFLAESIDVSLPELASNGNLVEVCFEVIEVFDSQGKLDQLYLAFRKHNPDKPFSKRSDLPPAKPRRIVSSIVRQRTGGSVKLRKLLKTSSFVFVLLFLVRFLGLIQSVELWSYDQLIKSRPVNDKPDDRIRIIEITEEDKEKYGGYTKGQVSLGDSIYNQLFERLKQYEPRTVGLDIYRTDRVRETEEGELRQLRESLKNDQNLFVVCKGLDPTIEDSTHFPPPPEVLGSIERIGFSDFIEDQDKVVRRHLMKMDLSEVGGNECPANDAFNLKIAFHYLNKNLPDWEPGKYLIGDSEFEPVDSFYGGYQYADPEEHNPGGEQILLNYRALDSPRLIAKPYTLEKVLADDGEKLKDDFKGKIVLIGISDPRNRDMWSTPFGDEEVPGVFMQAQMVSQILDIVDGSRSPIRVLPQWVEYLLIGMATGVGGSLVCYCRLLRSLVIIQSIYLGVIISLCWALFSINSYWLPIVPITSASLLSSVVMLVKTDTE